MNLYQQALELKDIITENRLWLHRHPELGLELPQTADFVEKKLRELGYQPRRIGKCGLVADIGRPGGKCLLLRADMDALPIREQAQVDYRADNGRMHACGHDCHTAALLGAAQLLKSNEQALEGLVRLMFQPAEETMDGGKMMVEGGALAHPKVDAAFSMHVFPNMPMEPGTILLTGLDSKFAAVDWFTVHITGKGTHGAQPHNGVDPLNVAAHIHLALQAINAREVDPAQPLVLTVGQMQGGTIANVIPQEATLAGTLRTLSNEVREEAKARMEAIVRGVALAFGAQARVEYGSGCPVLIQNRELYAQIKEICKTLEGVTVLDADEIGLPAGGGMGSEDFAYVAAQVPAIFPIVAAGRPEEGYCYPTHHPKAQFDNDALPAAAAAYAHIAIEWLKRNK